jgi:hypothetical protein
MSRTRVNNWSVTWYRRFKLVRILCWHSKKHLKLQLASNGGDIYCGKCGMKKIGWIYDPNETI